MATSIISVNQRLNELIKKRIKLRDYFHEAMKESEKSMHRGHVMIAGYDKVSGNFLINFFWDEFNLFEHKERIEKVFEDNFWIYFSRENKKVVCNHNTIAETIADIVLENSSEQETALEIQYRKRPQKRIIKDIDRKNNKIIYD